MESADAPSESVNTVTMMEEKLGQLTQSKLSVCTQTLNELKEPVGKCNIDVNKDVTTLIAALNEFDKAHESMQEMLSDYKIKNYHVN